MRVSGVLILMLFNIYIINADDCEYTTPNGTLNLKAFGYTDRPKYSNIPDTSAKLLTYSFNGCYSYSTKDGCQNAAACANDMVGNKDRLLARQVGRQYLFQQGISTIIYTDGSGTKLSVYLVCKTPESMTATKSDDKTFIFYIESECACPGKCSQTPDKPPSGGGGGLAHGTVFLIIFISIIATYLIVGVLFLRFVKHERGLDLVPNRRLWSQVGSDSIGGVRFIWSKVTGRNNYEKF